MNTYPPMVQLALSKMTNEQKLAFESEYERQKKDPTIYVVLAIFFPIQLVLLNRLGLQLAFWLTSGGMFVWYFIEWFWTPQRVREYNNELAINIARNLTIMTKVA